MANLRKKYIKMPVEEESVLTEEALKKKLADIMDRQYRVNLLKLKSSPVFLWSKLSEDRYALKFYHSYKEDMCDTMMTVDIEKGLERCSVHGLIHKPPAIWAVFWGVIASVLIDFIVISAFIVFGDGSFDIVNGLVLEGCIGLVRAYICVSLLEISRDRVKNLRGELLRVIRDEKQAELFRQRYEEEPDDFEQKPLRREDDGVEIIDDGEE